MKPKYPEGFLKQNLANCQKKTMCEGGCEHHEYGVRAPLCSVCGKPHRLTVLDAGSDQELLRMCDKCFANTEMEYEDADV